VLLEQSLHALLALGPVALGVDLPDDQRVALLDPEARQEALAAEIPRADTRRQVQQCDACVDPVPLRLGPGVPADELTGQPVVGREQPVDGALGLRGRVHGDDHDALLARRLDGRHDGRRVVRGDEDPVHAVGGHLAQRLHLRLDVDVALTGRADQLRVALAG
jgi:hypothetical protein